MHKRAEVGLRGEERRRLRHDSLENHDAGRKVRGGHDAGARSRHRRAHRGFVFLPAGGADDDAAAAGKHSGHILDGGLGSGEVDDRVDAGQRSGSESGGALVLVDVEGGNGVATLAGYLSDQAAGFSLA